MKIHQLKIPATDGFLLSSTLYRSESQDNNNKVLLIASATAVKQIYYKRYAIFMAEEGFTVMTFDYRGIGNSLTKKIQQFHAFMHEWGEKDLAGIINWLSVKYHSAQLLLVGHSGGGQMIGLADNKHKISAMVSIASQSGYWGFWDAPRKYWMAALWYIFIPFLTKIFSYFPAKKFKLGEDLPAGIALEWARWGRNPNYFFEERHLKQKFNDFKVPILIYSFEDDTYAPKRSVENLMTFYGSQEKIYRHIDPLDLGVSHIGHFGFFSRKFRTSLWQETSDWLKRE